MIGSTDLPMKILQRNLNRRRNEKECVCSAPNCCDMEQRGGKIIKEMPGSVASGTRCIYTYIYIYI